MLAFEEIRDGHVPWQANKIAQMLLEQMNAEVRDHTPTYTGRSNLLPERPFHGVSSRSWV
jgi:hypothetical protein